jgi:hypothetical protein
VGSARFSLETLEDVKRQLDRSCAILICPEGISKQVETFVLFASELSALWAGKIIFRFHPDTTTKDVSRASAKLLHQKGIEISTGAQLEDDLGRASYLVYQKSSVALQALAHKIPLVFLSDEWTPMSPLSICNDIHELKVSSAAELNELLVSGHGLEKQIYTPHIKHLCQDFDADKIKELLKL